MKLLSKGSKALQIILQHEQRFSTAFSLDGFWSARGQPATIWHVLSNPG